MRKAAVMQYDSTDEERTVASGHTCHRHHQQQQQSERASSSSSRRRGGPTLIISQPNPDDILCGKEKHCIIHDGTRRYRKFIDAFQPRYNAATTKQEKMEITKEIVTTLGRTARFLRYNKELDAYEELSHLEARDKTSHALRTACKRISKQQKKLTSSSASAASIISSSNPMVPGMAPGPGPVQQQKQQQQHVKPAAVLSTPLVLDAVSSSTGVTTAGSNTTTTPNHRQWQPSSHHHHHHHHRHHSSRHHHHQHHQQRQLSSNERYHPHHQQPQRARLHRGLSSDHHHPLPIHSNQQMDGALFDDLMTLLKDPTEPAVEESE